MLITVYRSKRDVNGNVYYATSLTSLGQIHMAEKMSINNICESACYNLGHQYVEIELPIRKFNAITKDWKYNDEVSTYLNN